MKFSGKIGFCKLVETAPDVIEEQYVEHSYKGDFERKARSLQNEGEVNDTPSLNMTISVVGDAYGFCNYQDIRYVAYKGNKWKVTSIDVQYPRLKLTIGGLYHAAAV